MAIHKIVDAITGEETLIDYTKKELDEQKALQAADAALLAAETARAQAKAAALAKLGITAEDLAALL